MKAYKVDFDGTKFVKLEFDVQHEGDFSNDPEGNYVEWDNTHNCDSDVVDNCVNNLNKIMVPSFDNASLFDDDISDENIIVKKCKECGKYFIIDFKEFIWFRSRGLSTPNRCVLCRHRRRRCK